MVPLFCANLSLSPTGRSLLLTGGSPGLFCLGNLIARNVPVEDLSTKVYELSADPHGDLVWDTLPIVVDTPRFNHFMFLMSEDKVSKFMRAQTQFLHS